MRGTLSRLVDAWRADRDPTVAEAVVELGDRLAADVPALGGKTRKAVLAAWCAAAASDDPAALSALLPTLADGNSKEATARLEALVALPPDPRVSRALAALLAAPPFQAMTTRPFWKLAAAELVRSGDPGVEALLAPLAGTFVERLGGARTMAEELEKATAAARRGLAAIPSRPPSGAVAEAVAEVAATRPDPIEAALEEARKVPWATLEHAYGEAEDVPALLGALARGEPAERLRALDQLHGNVYHQGSVFDATPPVARFVGALVAAGHPDTALLLGYLAHLAVNDPDTVSMTGGGDPWAGVAAEGDDAPFVRTAAAVAEAGPAVVRCLDHADPRVREAAVFLASFLPGIERAAARTVERQGRVETDERARAGQILFLARLGTATPAPDGATALVRDAVVLARARAEGSGMDGGALADLRALARSDRRVAGFPWFGGELSRAARVLEEALAIDPPEVVLDALEQALTGSDRRAAADRIRVARRRLFQGGRVTPKWLPAELDEHQLRFCRLLLDRADREADEYASWPHLEDVGLFLTPASLRRWIGRGPPGPLDLPLPDGRPLWKVLSDALYGHLTRDDALRALATASAVRLAEAVAETRAPVTGWRVYELERHERHVVEDAADPPTHRLDLGLRHNDRFADLVAEVALLAGEDGWRAVAAIGQRELDRVAEGGFAEGVSCALAATTAVRRASRTGGPPDDRAEAWLAETMTTAPVQRTPRRTEEVLRALPQERAERLVVEHCPVWREGTITENGRSRPSLFFDDSLRYARLLPRPPRAMTERVIAAIERRAEVLALTPRHGPGAPELPEEELLDWLRWDREVAGPLLAEAIGRGSPAEATLRRLADLIR